MNSNFTTKFRDKKKQWEMIYISNNDINKKSYHKKLDSDDVFEPLDEDCSSDLGNRLDR